ncbi:uncharacterized protein LOC124130877 isoform X3 [Haliotis rufescens]|uniref:uncharacterized protein LOC124130877 isoform X3 n=1 Tax=Haliotis rufescens TaxID=6454 RepID=UPI00201FA7A9|nr:uncharacterized protein LOC124130877 isoform X3 [Haliotis rufescens]
MVHQLVVAVCVVLGLASHQVCAQWWGMGQGQGQGQGMGQLGGLGGGALGMGQGQGQAGGWGNNLFNPFTPSMQDNTLYQTCIAKNSNGDDMRVTFSLGNNNNFNNPMFNRFGGARSLRLSTVIASNPASTLQGQFQLVVTEFSRTEEVCSSRALGDILTDRTWWSQSRTPRGIVGTPVTIYQGQTATSSETVENLSFEELTGRGLALCPSHQISGSTCMDVIPLCCKIGFDSQPATTSFTAQNQLFGQGLLGMQNPGSNNGLGGGFNQRMGGGQSQGMNQGLPSGLNGGFGQGGLPSNNAGSQNMRLSF